MSNSDIYFLSGVGHFGFGFIVGALLSCVLLAWKRQHLGVQMYAPFIPFSLALVAMLPYVFFFQKTCELPLWANIFVFYSLVHCHAVVVASLGNVHFVAVICGLIYCVIVMHYIVLVKRVRRYGRTGKRRG